jgi:IclR family transcriptional regulator, acetate operon repressor
LFDLLGVGPAYQRLTERSGLSSATVHRTLKSLLDAGLVERNPDSLRYSLGSELVYLSQRYLMRLPIVQAMAPTLSSFATAQKRR